MKSFKKNWEIKSENHNLIKQIVGSNDLTLARCISL